MTTSTPQTTDWIAVARGIGPQLEAQAQASDDAGSATPAAVELLRDAGMFGLMVPAELGGSELGLAEWAETLAALSYADGSLGWTALANSTVAGFASRWLADEAAKTIFDGGAAPALAGQFTPRGKAVVEAGGYRVSGKYSFGSGSNHSEWVGGGAMEVRDGRPAMLESGIPVTLGFFVRREQIRFTGNWDVMGLKATGSFDYEVSEQVVDEGFTFFQHLPAVRGRGAASFSTAVLGVAGHAGWALGVGRRALDEVLRTSQKPQTRITGANADREGFLHDIARLDAALSAARLLVQENFAALDALADRGEPPTAAQLARFAQVNRHVTRVALEVVRESFEWAGVSAIRPCALQRCYLDMSVAALHLSQTRESFVGMGRHLVSSSAEV